MRRKPVIKKIQYLYFCSLILFSSCVDIPDEILMPEWDVDLTVPIIKEHYSIQEIIKSQKYISVDSSGNNLIYLLESESYGLDAGLTEFVNFSTDSSRSDMMVFTSEADTTRYLGFPGGTEVESAVFERGNILIGAYNPSPAFVDVFIRIPGLSDPLGNEVTRTMNLAPLVTDYVQIDLSGYNYNIPPGQPYRDSIEFSIRATPRQDGVYVVMGISCTGLFLRTLTGKIETASIGTYTYPYAFEVGKAAQYRDKTTLREASLIINAEYQSVHGIPVGVEIRDLNIIAKRNDGSSIFLEDSTGSSDLNLRFVNGNINKLFTESNSNINDFVTWLPDSVIINAEYIINPENISGTFDITDSVKFETRFSTRSYLAVRNTTIEDTTRLQISDTDRKDMRKGKNAEIRIEIENAIPMDAMLKVVLADSNHTPLFTLTNHQEEGDTLFFLGPSIDQNGEAVGSFMNPLKTLLLDSAEVRMFSEAVYALYSVTFNTKNCENNPPPVVALRPSSWIGINAYGTFKYRIDFDNQVLK